MMVKHYCDGQLTYGDGTALNQHANLVAMEIHQYHYVCPDCGKEHDVAAGDHDAPLVVEPSSTGKAYTTTCEASGCGGTAVYSGESRRCPTCHAAHPTGVPAVKP